MIKALQGFYRGRGPWWLVGWKGKIFFADGTGYNLFHNLFRKEWKYRFSGKRKIRFSWEECAGTVYIRYDKHDRIIDMMVPDGDGWKGKIYVYGIKVGRFTLMR